MIMRGAPANDSDFVVEAIIAAEKSNSVLLSYSAIFKLDGAKVADRVRLRIAASRRFKSQVNDLLNLEDDDGGGDKF